MPKGIADYHTSIEISALLRGGAFDGDFVDFPFLGLTCQRYLIRYRHRRWPRDMRPQLIRVEWTRCHFGGRRPWFICAFCERQVGKLYEILGGLACRTCANLAYASQSMGKTRRRRVKAERLRRLMGDEGRPAVDPLPRRLRGKHRRAHELKCQKIHAVEAELRPGYRHNPRRNSRWRF